MLPLNNADRNERLSAGALAVESYVLSDDGESFHRLAGVH
jgi:hypothetical protein